MLNLQFIDETTGEAFNEGSGTFQLVSNYGTSEEKIVKSWNISEGSEITISDLSRECPYELRYIDNYHGEFPDDYKYEIDYNKGISRFSFGEDDELCLNIYLKKRYISDPYLLGDVNSDNNFNIADVAAFQKWLLCKPDTVLMNWRASDLCKDDVLNAFDLCLMKNELVKNELS